MDRDQPAASAEFLTFRLGGEEYAIDILRVQEIRARETVTRIASAPAYVKGVINLRGAVVPIVDLRVKFGFADDPAGHPVMIILNIGSSVFGVVVDAVSDVLRLEPGAIRPAPDLGGAIASGFIRGIAPVELRMLIVVDIERLVTGDEVGLVNAAAA